MRLLGSLGVRLALLFLLGLLLFLGVALRRHSVALTPPLQPLPQDPLIQVYFNHSQAASYTDSYHQRQRLGDDLEQLVVTTINSAQTSIDLAVHELNLPHIAQALRAKHQAGVAVRVIVENTYTRPLSQLTLTEINRLNQRERKKYDEFVQLVDSNGNGQLSDTEIAQNDAIAVLLQAQVPIIDDTADGSAGSDLMHHKFMVVDGKTVIVGSANFTLSDIHGDYASPASQGNANHLLHITSPAVAKLFTQEFNLLWGDGPGGQTNSQFGLKKPYRSPQTLTLAPHSTLTLQFSPTSTRLPWNQSVNGLIARVLNQATRTVDLMLFVFSEQKLSDVLKTKHQQGVQVRALIDPGFAYRDYSELLDMSGIALANNHCNYEAENRPWSRPIATGGIPNLPTGDLLHHKVGIVDGRMVITGSQNWSNAANEGNDENLLVIENPTVAAHFQREFDRLYENASLGIPSSVQAKIRQQQTRCRT
jgi:phosphatidylserine/phosphatidylglycerophosphate/cardiolipin synthase-like enzyme